MRAGLKQTMAVGILSAVLASGCGSQSHPATTSITVFASSAMIKSLTAIGKQFEAENPGTSVEFIFASSSDLSAELADGNDADVFVSGDYDNMSAVATAGLIASTPLADCSEQPGHRHEPGQPRQSRLTCRPGPTGCAYGGMWGAGRVRGGHPTARGPHRGPPSSAKHRYDGY